MLILNVEMIVSGGWNLIFLYFFLIKDIFDVEIVFGMVGILMILDGVFGIILGISL